MNALRQAADRWRWFWHKDDIITMDAQRRFGADRRPLNRIEAPMARAVARQSYQDLRAMPRPQRAAERRLYMAGERARRDGLRDWHKKVRTGR